MPSIIHSLTQIFNSVFDEGTSALKVEVLNNSYVTSTSTSSTDGDIAVMDGTTGKVVRDSTIAVSLVSSAVQNAASVGTGNAVFFDKSGANLRFKKLAAGSNITISDDGLGTLTFAGVAAYTDQMAKDAVGGILTDTASIDFTYGAGIITAAVLPAGVSHNSLANLTTGDVHTQYAILAGRAGGQTLIGGTAASDAIVISSTSSGTKGAVTLGQGYKENASGQIVVGDPTQAATTNEDFTWAQKGGSSKFIFKSSGGQKWVGFVSSGNLSFNRAANDITGIAINTASLTQFGDGTPVFGVTMAQPGSTQTAIASTGSGDPCIAVRNRSSTNNNFSGIVFENNASSWDSGVFGVHKAHTTTSEGQLHFAVRNSSGTKQVAFFIDGNGVLNNALSSNESAAITGTAAATEYLKVFLASGATRYIPLVTSPN